MKTNLTSRQVIRVRRVLSLFTFVVLVGFAALLGGTMADRLAPTSPSAGQPTSANWNITVTVPDLSMLAR